MVSSRSQFAGVTRGLLALSAIVLSTCAPQQPAPQAEASQNVLGILCNLDDECDDSDVCTNDVCVGQRCVNARADNCCLNGESCDDGDSCTQDSCGDLGLCEHAPISGCCASQAECDDGSACTVDSCDPAGGCKHEPIDNCCNAAGDCDDGNSCTLDSCNLLNGHCVYVDAPLPGCCATSATCTDLSLCTLDVCGQEQLQCIHLSIAGCCVTAADCDDANACTDDICTLSRCSHVDLCSMADAGTADGGSADGGSANAGSGGGSLDGGVGTDAATDAGWHDSGLPQMDAASGDAGQASADGGSVLPSESGVKDAGEQGAAGSSGSGTAASGGDTSGVGGSGGVGNADGGHKGADAGDAAVTLVGGAGGRGADDGNAGTGGGETGAGGDIRADGGTQIDRDTNADGDAGAEGDTGADADDSADDSKPWVLRGGGCSALGPDPHAPPGAALIVCALLWLCAWRRRRSRLGGAVLLLALLPTRSAAAQLRLDHYRAPAQPEDLLWTPRAAPQGGLPFVRIAASFADDPLVATEIGTGRERGVVESQLGLSLSVGASFGPLHVGAGIPFFVQSFEPIPAGTNLEGYAPGTSGFGDASLHARFAALDLSDIELGVGAVVTLPVGDQSALAGEGTVTVTPQVIASHPLSGRGYVSVALHSTLRSSTDTTVRTGSQLGYAAGAFVDVFHGLGPVFEVSGQTMASEAFRSSYSALEGTLGGRYEMSSWMASAGASMGFFRAVGTPDVRALLSVGYRVHESATPPSEPHTVKTTTDLDGDGLLPPADACALEAEDRDGFEDDDGCPDPDNDGDGIVDVNDACPTDPEDKDGFEDDNGCPDPDNDGDSVLDAQDACPTAPEDKDGFKDDDGCPDIDNDADGLVDTKDECPLDPETVNGHDDDDGCPDLIRVNRAARRIQVLEKVYFATGSDRILPHSFAMLEEMAATLSGQLELGRVSIEGHTDARGDDEENLSLSQRRAQSVRQWLADHGVSRQRLLAVGHGEAQPVEDNATVEGRAENRRVEFHLIDLGTEVAPGGDDSDLGATQDEPQEGVR